MTEYASPRRELLEKSAELVNGDRNVQYGDPVEDFRRTATYWSTHAGGVLRRKIEEFMYAMCGPDVGFKLGQEEILDLVDHLFDPHDVAIMMGQLKASRLAWSPEKEDHWVDSAGYMACGWDCVASNPTI